MRPGTQRYRCVVLPEFEAGALPPGVHPASWQVVEDRFGWNAQRRNLLKGLKRVLEELATAGCPRAWLDGSFVTTKEVPGDFDLVWDPEGVDLDHLDAAFHDLEAPRSSQHEKYGGDILPNVVERASGLPFIDFFQQDDVTGDPRGIVQVELGEFT